MIIATTDARPLLLGECAKCPLYVDDDYKHLVRGFGTADRLMIVGEAPGATEVAQGKPFVGESGRLIRSVLTKLGVHPDEDVYWTNAVLCRPPGNKTPTPTTIKLCNDRLLKVELPMVAPQKILALGGVALSAVLGTPAGLPITKWHGRSMWVEWADEIGSFPPRALAMSTYHPSAVLRDLDLFRDFAYDIEKLISRSAPIPDIEYTWVVATDGPEALGALKELADGADELSLDIETMGLNPMSDDIISIGFGSHDPDRGVIIPLAVLNGDLTAKAEVARFIQEYNHPLVLQNGKFDLQFLDVYFEQALRPKHVKDTMLLHYALDERPIGRYAAHGLKDLARIHYDAPDYKFDFPQFYASLEKQRLQLSTDDYQTWYDETMSKLYEYQVRDCIYTAKLHVDLSAELEAEYPEGRGLLETLLYPGSMAFTEVELYGVKIDLEYLRGMKADYTERLEGFRSELETIAWEGFNPLSPVQVVKLLFDEWQLDDSRGRSTEREALDSLVRRTKNPAHVDGIKKIIEYRLRAKVLATYIDGMLTRVDSDGRLRTDIRLAGTATGRLSSSDPNLQNIPTLMGQEIRDAFISEDGYTFLEVDYSQLELRVAAWLSEDEKMIQTFKDGKDIHRAVAAAMFNKREEDISEHERYLAKYVDFGVIYGRGALSLAEGWEMDYLEEKLGGVRWTLPQAEKFLNEFLAGFPQLTAWMKRQQNLGFRQQYVSSATGRRRRFPFVSDRLKSHIGRQAVNTPIQGFASDICLSSLIRLHNSLPEGANVLFPVHDAIYFEVRDDLLDAVIPLIHDGMERDLPNGIDQVVPIPVKLKAGRRWGQVEEIK